MKYFFDASSVYVVVRAKRAELLIENYTSSLARYELGNTLLTERRRKILSESEQRSLFSAITDSLNIMYNVDITNSEQEIVELAIRYGLTFYDASYAYAAKRSGATLVTEDKKLAQKIKVYVGVLSARDLIPS